MNQLGIDLLQCFRAETQSLGGAGCQVLHEDICFLHELAHDLFALLGLEVENH